jgi:ribosomal-protein-alanine N-acetyltransferase
VSATGDQPRPADAAAEPLEVRGPRLTLRYATFDDAPALFDLGSDAAVTRFFSWGPYARIAEAEAYVAGLEVKRDRGELLEFVVVDRDAGVIGVTGLSDLSRRDRRAVVGTWFGHRFWGSGANRESKALVAALAFGHLGLERLTAMASTLNERSQASLERMGFAREGVLAAWHRHGDEVHDLVVYALLRGAWERSELAGVPVTVRGAAPRAFVV